MAKVIIIVIPQVLLLKSTGCMAANHLHISCPATMVYKGYRGSQRGYVKFTEAYCGCISRLQRLKAGWSMLCQLRVMWFWMCLALTRRRATFRITSLSRQHANPVRTVQVRLAFDKLRSSLLWKPLGLLMASQPQHSKWLLRQWASDLVGCMSNLHGSYSWHAVCSTQKCMNCLSEWFEIALAAVQLTPSNGTCLGMQTMPSKHNFSHVCKHNDSINCQLGQLEMALAAVSLTVALSMSMYADIDVSK